MEELLAGAALNFSVIDLAGGRHFLVSPGRDSCPPGRKMAILAAHYDRVPGSPGANDNSAAVFLLLETAMRLREDRAEGWLIIFTDREELSPGESLTRQGSYALGLGLKNAGFGGGMVYSFDACGAGDTLIISTTAEELLKAEGGPGVRRARQRVRELRDRALGAARDLGMDRVLLLPTPFSDDAGFLRAGVAAQTITVLPREEAARFAALLRKEPGLSAALLSRERQGPWGAGLIPETWRSLNGPADSRLRLTPRHYGRIIRFARTLCGG